MDDMRASMFTAQGGPTVLNTEKHHIQELFNKTKDVRIRVESGNRDVDTSTSRQKRRQTQKNLQLQRDQIEISHKWICRCYTDVRLKFPDNNVPGESRARERTSTRNE